MNCLIENPMKFKDIKLKHFQGFTLVEILVVIAIIAVLAALGFTGARKFMNNAQNARNSNNFRQLTFVARTFSSENNGVIMHEDQTTINGQMRGWWQHMLVTLSPDLALNEGYKNSVGNGFGRSTGIFGDANALKKGKQRIATSGHGSYRSYAYNNRIGLYDQPEVPGSRGWGTGVRYLHQIEEPNKLILFAQKTLDGSSYPYYLQPEDASVGRVYFDLYGGSAMVGFSDGHVEKFTRSSFPSGSAKNPNTGRVYTEREKNLYWFGTATPLAPL